VDKKYLARAAIFRPIRFIVKKLLGSKCISLVEGQHGHKHFIRKNLAPERGRDFAAAAVQLGKKKISNFF